VRLQVQDGADRAAADASNEYRVEFTANPMQNLFITEREAEAVLWAARKGEGKSTGLVWAIFHHTRENPGAHDYLVRDTFVNLEASTMVEFFKWFKPGIFGTYHEGKREFRWTAGEMRGVVHFIGLDTADDANKIASRPIGGAFIDEAAPADAESGGIAEDNVIALQNQLRQSGVKWHCCKLAENAPDESHWTYRAFVDPGTPRYKYLRSDEPENTKNLPENYYEAMKQRFIRQGRTDLVRRMVDGTWGFQQLGKAVTPEWNDRMHLARNLRPVRGPTLYLGWDFGHNPTCIVTQISPMGFWNVLEAHVGDGIGVEELIADELKLRLATDYRNMPLEHVGDRAGQMREQSSIKNSAVKTIQRLLGGRFHNGPNDVAQRVDPLRAVLRRQSGGVGIVQVDRDRARAVWHALRGGWHRKVGPTGIVSPEITKNIHSHPGDALGYLASWLFPLSRIDAPANNVVGGATSRGLSYQGRRNGLGNPMQTPPPRHGAPMRY
jgi:hypothetical protein